MSESATEPTETEQCAWCREPVDERTATGPYGEAYCSGTCAENADREVEYD